MPIYEYKCSECDHTFEKIQKLSHKPVRSCPECRGRVRKLISQSAFVLKGGGWYSDGYNANGGSKSASGGNGEAKSAPKTKAKESKSKAPAAAKVASAG